MPPFTLKNNVVGLLFLCLLFSNAKTEAQKNKSFFRIELSYPFGGTPRLIKKTMKETGYDNSTTVGFTKSYPNSSHYPGVAVEGGKFISEKISLSVLAGIEEAGKVGGYNTNRGGIHLNFINWVVQPKFNYHTKGAVLSLGPSALFVNYKAPDPYFSYKHSKILPGLGITAASAPRKTKGFRMTVFTTFNLHPTFEAETMNFTTNSQSHSFQTDINPSNLQIGLRFQF